MHTLAALRTRSSVAPPFLGPPGPDEAMLAEILGAGANAPDHGRLRPWRFLVFQAQAREQLGEIFAAALLKRQPDASEESLAQERNRPMRAPLVLVVVAKLDPDHPKIPEFEQILSAGAAVQNLLLAAHSQGFGAKWLSGTNAYDSHVTTALGLGPNDRVAGIVHIGTVKGDPPQAPRADAGEFTTQWGR
ncbi:MAG: nitroreductase [Pseudomonadota bacterium]